MANPSTIWTQLAIPNPASGSLPFVDTDNASIITDVLNFYYTSSKVTPLTGSQLAFQLSVLNGVRQAYTDTSAVPGAATINKSAGRVAIAAGQSSVVVTSANCFATSIVMLQLETNDATLNRVIAVPAAGSFTITGNANATGNTKVSYTITNVF